MIGNLIRGLMNSDNDYNFIKYFRSKLWTNVVTVVEMFLLMCCSSDTLLFILMVNLTSSNQHLMYFISPRSFVSLFIWSYHWNAFVILYGNIKLNWRCNMQHVPLLKKVWLYSLSNQCWKKIIFLQLSSLFNPHLKS